MLSNCLLLSSFYPNSNWTLNRSWLCRPSGFSSIASPHSRHTPYSIRTMPLKYYEWARLVSMTSGIWTMWGAIWGIFYRKFFWDMIGGTLGPAGLEPPPSADIFIFIIVKLPIIQGLGILTGFTLIAVDWPVPFLKNTFLHRNHMYKIILLLIHSFFSAILYQAVDSALVAWIAMAIYIKAQMVGERVGGPEPRRRTPGQV